MSKKNKGTCQEASVYRCWRPLLKPLFLIIIISKNSYHGFLTRIILFQPWPFINSELDPLNLKVPNKIVIFRSKKCPHDTWVRELGKGCLIYTQCNLGLVSSHDDCLIIKQKWGPSFIEGFLYFKNIFSFFNLLNHFNFNVLI